MQVKRYNVSKPIKYEKNGEQRTKWHNVGQIAIFEKDDGTVSGTLELITFTGEIKLNIFPAKEREEQPKQVNNEEKNVNDEIQEIQIDEIPF